MRAHLIEKGVVVNTLEVESLDFMPGLVLATGGGVGLGYADGVFTPPVPAPEPVPQSITMRQCRLQLLTEGLLDDVDTAISSIQDSAARRAAQIEWEYAATVVRTSAWVGELAKALGLTDEALDRLFVEAAKL